MANLEKILIDDGNCFACGTENPIGLKLKFRIEPGSGVAVCETTLADHFNGWKGAAHGGIITTLLDETMVYACTSTGVFTVTGSISVRFHKPVPTGEPVTVTGWIDENRKRSVTASGKIELNGTVLASASAVLIPVKQVDHPMEAIKERLVQ